MKLPRNTRIFRGQLDVAPVACVFFMTALLLFLHSQIAFIPGIRLDLSPSRDTNKPSLFIDADKIFHFAGEAMSQQGFIKRLRADAEKNRAPDTILFQTEQGVTTNEVDAVRALAADLSISLEAPGTRVALPEAPDQPGTKGPSIIVAVNLSGQVFYENQMIDEKDLAPKLAEAAAQAREPMTLILRLDRATAIETFVRLSDMARKAGFSDVVLATRPPLRPGQESAL